MNDIPYSKQEIGLSSKVEHTFDRTFIGKLMQTKEGREASDALTKAIMAPKNWNAVSNKIEENK